MAALACVRDEVRSPRANDCASLTERGRIMPLLDFEGAVDLGDQEEPRATFGARSSIGVESEEGNHFLRVRYESFAGAPKGAATQSSYTVTLPYTRVNAPATLVLRYRSRGVKSAVLRLDFLDQNLLWRVNPVGPSGWVHECLSLDSRFEKDPTSSPLAALTIISYSSEPSPSRATYFDLDDLRLVESSGGDSRRLKALQDRIEADNARRAAIDAAVELRDVRTSRKRYVVGDPVVLSFEIHNGSDVALRIPRDRTGDDGYPLVTSQAWIEPLDAAARQTDFGLAARRGSEFAAGGWIRSLPQPILQADGALKFTQRLQALAPGRYRASIEIASIADRRVLAAKSTSFEVEPDR